MKQSDALREGAMEEAEEKAMKQRTVMVYLDDGRVFEYDVADAAKAREHSAAIVGGGYRHNDGETFEHYPPWRILKVKVIGEVPTLYTDCTRGT